MNPATEALLRDLCKRTLCEKLTLDRLREIAWKELPFEDAKDFIKEWDFIKSRETTWPST
jgi:hypothetical protein